MDAQTNKVASIILGPILEKHAEESSHGEDLEDSLSAEDEFMGNSLIQAIEKKDIKGILKILRSIRR